MRAKCSVHPPARFCARLQGTQMSTSKPASWQRIEQPGRRPLPLALLALAIGAFGIGTTEFLMMGLLPEVAADFQISIPSAGHLISGYALGVVFGAPLLTAASVRWPRRNVLIGLMVVFIAGNLLAAMASRYEMLLVARVLTGLPHGAFFGIGSVVAAGMVGPDRRATAISLMFAGLGVANVAAIALLVPQPAQAAPTQLSREIAAFGRPQVWLALAIGTLGFGGVFAAYSYIEPMMTNVAGYSPGDVDLLLALFGLGMTAGNLVGGRLADRALMPSLYGALGGLGLVLALFVFTAHSQAAAAVTIFLIGATGMACVPIIQMRIMEKARDAPTLAAAANHSAFNMANAAGAFLAGRAINAGFGWTSPNWVGAILAACGLGLAIVSGALDRRDGSSPAARAAGARVAPMVLKPRRRGVTM